MHSSTLSPQRSATLLLLAACLSLTACASSSDRRGPPSDSQRGERGDRPARTSGTFLQPAALLFSEMDLNKDKLTTRAEMLTGIDSEWEDLGSNKSAVNFSAWSIKTLGSTDANPTFMSFDRDFNQVITKAEFSNQIERLFTRYDKNKDGAIERSEMVVSFEAPRGREQGRGGQGGAGRGNGGGGRPPR